MENGEMISVKQKDVDQSGFSEKKLDQNTELQAGQWLDLKKGVKKSPLKVQNVKTSQKKPKQLPLDKKEDLLKELREHTSEHHRLVQEYSTLSEYSSKESERMMQRIFVHQSTIKNLLQSLKRSS